MWEYFAGDGEDAFNLAEDDGVWLEGLWDVDVFGGFRGDGGVVAGGCWKVLVLSGGEISVGFGPRAGGRYSGRHCWLGRGQAMLP